MSISEKNHPNLLFTWEGFNSLDASKQFTFLKDSLEIMEAQPCNQLIQKRVIEKLDLQPGQKILEVGCGLGKRARRLSEVNPKTSITAIDLSEKLLAVAREKNAAENIIYQAGNVEQLPFLDNTFDVVTAERLLICFEDALWAVKEMARVLKPGGKIALTDFDPASIVISPGSGHLSELFMQSYLPSFNDPYIGRKLPELCKKAGLNLLEIKLDLSEERDMVKLEKIIHMQEVLEGGVRAGIFSQEQAADWLMLLRQASNENYFVYAITVFSVIATKFPL